MRGIISIYFYTTTTKTTTAKTTTTTTIKTEQQFLRGFGGNIRKKNSVFVYFEDANITCQSSQPSDRDFTRELLRMIWVNTNVNISSSI